MLTIDPIKPYGPRHHAKPHIVRSAPAPRPHPKITRQSIDGIVPLPPFQAVRPVPRLVQPARKPVPHPHVQPVSPQLSSQFSASRPPHAAPKSEKTPKKRFTFPRVAFSKKGIAVAIVFIAVLVATAVVTQKPVGQLMVLLYGVMAVIMKIPSRTTFGLALGALVLVPISLAIIGGTNIISSGLATYAFLLLVIGTVSLGLELRREPKMELA